MAGNLGGHPRARIVRSEDENGASFLRSFSGFLATYGLDHTGAPFKESARRYFTPDRSIIEQPPARPYLDHAWALVSYSYEWRGDRCILFCEGIVKQVAVAGEHLVLTRRYETEIGASSFTLHEDCRSLAASFLGAHRAGCHALAWTFTRVPARRGAKWIAMPRKMLAKPAQVSQRFS